MTMKKFIKVFLSVLLFTGFSNAILAENRDPEPKVGSICGRVIDNTKQAIAPIAQPVVPPTLNSVADELSKLAKLKNDGILTEEEFQAQKSKLLGL